MMDLDAGRLRTRVDRALTEWIEPATVARRAALDAEIWTVPGEPVPFADASGAEFSPIASGTAWGRPWGTAWFRLGGIVPTEWDAAAGPLEVLVDLGFSQDWPGFQAEGLAFDPDGTIRKGIEPLNGHVRVEAAPGERVELLVEAAANPDILRGETFSPTPLGNPRTSGDAPIYVFRGAAIVQRDIAVEELREDVRVLREMLDILPGDRPRSARIRRALYDMLSELDPHRVAETASAARDRLADVLASPAHASAHEVVAVGHAHIDSAWLWPIRETIRKCARTFSNVLDLMDEDPDLVFACSSAQQYAWMQEHYPSIHERVAARIAEGRWVVTGGMWVESDTMMPGGEALVRQFLEGAAYFRDTFGVEAAGVWLPDSFGYSAAMPQIAVAAGASWFLTQKLSWNDTNRMPHHTFWWRGIDGTRVFTHFPPSDTYSARVTPAELDLAERQFTEHAHSSRSLLLFGHGDGGGGPTRRMLAAARRSADIEGLPRVRVASPNVFFAEAEAEQGERTSTWTGELYLELHRGTLTSQAKTKAGNRRNERLLHAAELWATTAAVRVGHPYPAETLQAAWRTVLLLQFHDILPGSAIGWVHEQAEATHAEVTATLEAIIADALSALAGTGELDLLANAAAVASGGIGAGAIAARSAGSRGRLSTDEGAIVLEDDEIRVEFDADGTIASFLDQVTGRDLVAPDRGFGVLRLHPDHPGRWDAWDIERQHRDAVDELVAAASVDFLSDERGDVVLVRHLRGGSTFLQEWWIADGVLETSVQVNWQERGLLLKLGFPLGVHADRFSAETQFGHVVRPMHENTPWDEARFEVCQHRWLHVGEPAFGVAIANDTTYGVAVRSDDAAVVDVGVSLLRGTGFPDPDSDRGEQRFRFSIAPAPHITDAVAVGRRLDAPLAPIRGARRVEPLVQVDSDALLLETIKLAHDGSGDIVARLSESCGGSARGVVVTSFDWSSVSVVDLHERPLAEESPLWDGVEIVADNTARAVAVHDRAFGIVTLRFSR